MTKKICNLSNFISFITRLRYVETLNFLVSSPHNIAQIMGGRHQKFDVSTHPSLIIKETKLERLQIFCVTLCFATHQLYPLRGCERFWEFNKKLWQERTKEWTNKPTGWGRTRPTNNYDLLFCQFIVQNM